MLQCLKMYFWVVSIVALINSSLLAVLLASLPELLKGYILGFLTATYFWLFICIVSHKSICCSLSKNSPENSDELNQIVGQLARAQITFHTFRHWKATMEHRKTRGILYVMQMLGHRNVKTRVQSYVSISHIVCSDRLRMFQIGSTFLINNWSKTFVVFRPHSIEHFTIIFCPFFWIARINYVSTHIY